MAAEIDAIRNALLVDTLAHLDVEDMAHRSKSLAEHYGGGEKQSHLLPRRRANCEIAGVFQTRAPLVTKFHYA